MKQVTPRQFIKERAVYGVRKPAVPNSLDLAGSEGNPPGTNLLLKVSQCSKDVLSRYPDTSRLRCFLADRLEVLPSQMLITAGADDALFRALSTVLQPGRELIFPTPSFEMITRYAEELSATIVRPSWGATSYPVDEVIASANENTSAVAIVSPNNPTGLTITKEGLFKIADSLPQCLIILDHAYVEFASQDLTKEARTRPNIVVIRTLSKAWGLAGLRVGYAVGQEDTIEWMSKVGFPFPTSGLSLQIAVEQLGSGQNEMTRFVSMVKNERSRLVALLSELGATPLCSEANFVFAMFSNAEEVFNSLAELGIAVRFIGNVGDFREALRITCPGNSESYIKLETALRKVL